MVLCPGCRHELNRRNRPFDACDNMSDGPPYTQNGLLAIIDVDKATKGMGQASIVTIIAAGCSPVRAVETADGQYVWVAARGRNTQLPLPVDPDARGSQVLGFNRSALVSASPNNAFLGYGDTHGTAPVGLGLFNHDTLLAVANSNRFHQQAASARTQPRLRVCHRAPPMWRSWTLVTPRSRPSYKLFPRLQMMPFHATSRSGQTTRLCTCQMPTRTFWK